MGIYYRAAIVVGLRHRDFTMNADRLAELIDEGALEVCSPYYDGGGDESAVVGFFCVTSPDYAPIELDLDDARSQASEQWAAFFKLTGQEAKLWLSPYGY
jgi:hypothetical protein